MTEAQRDLFGRKVRDLGPSEFEIHKSLVTRLRWQCRNGVLYFHCPNGEERDDRTAAKLQAMGVLPGVADLIFIWGELVAAPRVQIVPQVLFLELKRRGARQTTDQIEFEKNCKKAGCFYELADTIDDAVAILQRYAILPRQGGSHDNQGTGACDLSRAHNQQPKILPAQTKGGGARQARKQTKAPPSA